MDFIRIRRAGSALLSDAEKIISSVGSLIKVKAQLQILTLKADQRVGCNDSSALLDSLYRS